MQCANFRRILLSFLGINEGNALLAHTRTMHSKQCTQFTLGVARMQRTTHFYHEPVWHDFSYFHFNWIWAVQQIQSRYTSDINCTNVELVSTRFVDTNEWNTNEFDFPTTRQSGKERSRGKCSEHTQWATMYTLIAMAMCGNEWVRFLSKEINFSLLYG